MANPTLIQFMSTQAKLSKLSKKKSSTPKQKRQARPANTANGSARLIGVDVTRALAVILMVIFHFCYDLGYFDYMEMDVNAPFWAWFRYLIVTLFFLVVGISLVLSTRSGIRWRSTLIRLSQVGAGALAVTVATMVVFPKAWVYFGVLHFIFLAILCALPLVNWPRISLLLGISIFALFNLTDWFNTHFLFVWLQPILHLPNATQDLTRFIPWFGMVLIGIYLGQAQLRWFYWPSWSVFKPLVWIGQHALSIYLIHQVVLYGLVWGFYTLTTTNT